MTGSYTDALVHIAIDGPIEVFGPGASRPTESTIEARYGTPHNQWLITVPQEAKASLWFVQKSDGLAAANQAGLRRPITLRAAVTDSVGIIRIEVGERAQIEVYDELGTADSGLKRAPLRIEINQARGSQVKRLKVATSELKDSAECKVALQADARFMGLQIVSCLAPARSADDLKVSLQGQGSSADLAGLSLATGEDRVELKSNVQHELGHTTSRQNYKAVVGDRGRSRFIGEVMILPNAAKADAGQMHRSFLLDPKAESFTEPRLDIQCDDVKAAHGAAIGQLDPEHIFYFMSRGFSRSEAVEALARGFAFDVLEVLGVEESALKSLARAEIEQGIRRLGLSEKAAAVSSEQGQRAGSAQNHESTGHRTPTGGTIE